jgi:transcriptional regulator LmrA/YxaF-like protein
MTTVIASGPTGGKTQLIAEAVNLAVPDEPIIDASGDERLRQEARALLDQWRDSVHAALVKFGARKSTAEDDASVLLAALEGALILSRAGQSTEPLDTVQHFFTTSLT